MSAKAHEQDVVAMMGNEVQSTSPIPVTRRMFERILDETDPFDWFRHTGSIDATALGRTLRRIPPHSWAEAKAWVRIWRMTARADSLATVRVRYLEDALRTRVFDLYSDQNEWDHVSAAIRHLGA